MRSRPGSNNENPTPYSELCHSLYAGLPNLSRPSGITSTTSCISSAFPHAHAAVGLLAELALGS